MSWNTPVAFAASEDVTSTKLNDQLHENMSVIGGALTAYTPTYTNFALGNGTVAAAFAEAGKWIRCRGLITLGTTSSVTGTIRISLPVASLRTAFGAPLAGTATLVEASPAGRRFRVCALQSGTEFYMADLSDTRVDAAVPWAWQVNDTIEWSFYYEGA